MNAVLGYTQLIADEQYGPVTPLQKDHLGRVSASGKHLLGLIEQLLGYARIEAGEEHVRAAPVLLTEIVMQTLGIIRPLAEQKGLQITVEAPDAPVELYTDAVKVRQILINLLANAVKFSERGKVVLAVRVEGLDADVHVRFEVSDSGRGIASEDRQRVFDPFWQANPDQKDAAGGTGLGLSVARQLARLLGGDVAIIDSVLGRGTTFVLSLPVRYSGGAEPATR
jgi:signal transduction histidine kinase